jgi:hypothetical protein
VEEAIMPDNHIPTDAELAEIEEELVCAVMAEATDEFRRLASRWAGIRGPLLLAEVKRLRAELGDRDDEWRKTFFSERGLAPQRGPEGIDG